MGVQVCFNALPSFLTSLLDSQHVDYTHFRRQKFADPSFNKINFLASRSGQQWSGPMWSLEARKEKGVRYLYRRTPMNGHVEGCTGAWRALGGFE